MVVERKRGKLNYICFGRWIIVSFVPATGKTCKPNLKLILVLIVYIAQATFMVKNTSFVRLYDLEISSKLSQNNLRVSTTVFGAPPSAAFLHRGIIKVGFDNTDWRSLNYKLIATFLSSLIYYLRYLDFFSILCCRHPGIVLSRLLRQQLNIASRANPKDTFKEGALFKIKNGS